MLWSSWPLPWTQSLQAFGSRRPGRPKRRSAPTEDVHRRAMAGPVREQEPSRGLPFPVDRTGPVPTYPSMRCFTWLYFHGFHFLLISALCKARGISKCCAIAAFPLCQPKEPTGEVCICQLENGLAGILLSSRTFIAQDKLGTQIHFNNNCTIQGLLSKSA